MPQYGFSLIECLCAITVMALGVLFCLNTQFTLTHQQHRLWQLAKQQEQAHQAYLNHFIKDYHHEKYRV